MPSFLNWLRRLGHYKRLRNKKDVLDIKFIVLGDALCVAKKMTERFANEFLVLGAHRQGV